jgi:subfamily B ATP-binding cassette protein HlyB/CyaB
MAPRGDAGEPVGSSPQVHPVSAVIEPTAPAVTSMPVLSEGLSTEQFIWLLGSLAGVHGLAFDPKLAAQRFAPPYDAASLTDALQALGLETRPANELPEAGLDGATPYIAFARHSQASKPILVVVHEAERSVYFEALAQTPTIVSTHELAQRIAGPFIFARPRAAEPIDTDAATEQQSTKFGFRWFVPELLKHKRIWRDVLAASLVIQLLALGMPLMTQAIIDKVVVHRTESTLIALAVGLAIFTLFSALLTWIRQYLVLHTGTRIDAVLGTCVFRHLVSLPPRYFEHRPTGVIAARLHGVEQIREFLASAAVTLVLDLPFLSIALAIMFTYSVTLTLIVLGVLAVIALVSLVVSPIFQARLNRQFMLGARNQGFLTEYVAGIETVKSLQMEPTLNRKYGDFLAAYLQADLSTKQIGNTYHVIAQTLEQAMSLLILVVGALLVMRPDAQIGAAAGAVFTIGMLVAFQMFAGKISQPVLRMVGLWQQFQQARLAVQRLGDLMDAPAEPYSVTPARALNHPSPSTGAKAGFREAKLRAAAATGAYERPDAIQSGDGVPIVAIESLAFRHAEDRPYLYENLNLAIRAGECVALMGPSGSGKSTLAKLLQGYYQPARGTIRVGGVDSRHLSANELRANFGVVPQETVLFSGTILDNLLLADPHASFDDAVAACRMAEIHDAVEQLPQGYRTEIGERGAGLSGGQRQRLSIARALLKQPKLLIFDEATSNLDAETAARFARTVQTLRGKVAILFITHAAPAGLKFDRVVRLEDPSAQAQFPAAANSHSAPPGRETPFTPLPHQGERGRG